METKEHSTTQVCFKEKLIGAREEILEEDPEGPENWLSDDDELEETTEEGREECPTIRLTKEEKARIQLLRRSVGYNLLTRKIKEMWRPMSNEIRWLLIMVIFLRNSHPTRTMNMQIFGGPWMIFEHYLIVRPCQPNFDPNQSSLKRLPFVNQDPLLTHRIL